jgi:DNA-binding transcriptional MerR regulator
MFSIGEFARLGGVSVRTLTHYDEIGLLRPTTVDPGTGYRGYSAQQLGQLNRIMALKELGLSLTQARRLLDGITLDELRGMLTLRRAQLEHELEQHKNQLLGVEGRLRSIAREGAMPAGDIVAKKIPAMGVFRFFGARLFRQTDPDDLRLIHGRKRTFGHAGARKWMGPLARGCQLHYPVAGAAGQPGRDRPAGVHASGLVSTA